MLILKRMGLTALVTPSVFFLSLVAATAQTPPAMCQGPVVGTGAMPGAGVGAGVIGTPGMGLNIGGGAYGRIGSYSAYDPYASGMGMPNPYSYGGYGNTFVIPDPYSGYLNGSANVINAQGQYLINVEKAYYQQQEAVQKSIETRRKAFDQWLYEKANTPTLEDQREAMAASALHRAAFEPPNTEVASGTSLNVLLNAVRQKLVVGDVKGPDITLDEDLLKKINPAGLKGGNLGLLRNEGKLTWVATLRDLPGSEESRQKIDELMLKAFNEAKEGSQVDTNTLNEINNAAKKLDDMLVNSQFPPPQYIEAKRYLNQLQEAVTMLRQSGPGNNVVSKFSFSGMKGNTVGDLLKYMAENGLEFGAATNGDETAYKALHTAVADYATVVAPRSDRDSKKPAPKLD